MGYPDRGWKALTVVDALTVRAAQAGDQTAIAAIVDDFMPTVLGAAYGLCGNWETASDIAQETFATMLVRIGDLREPDAIAGWLMAVVRSSARRERRTPPLVVPDRQPLGPEDVVVARDSARRIRLAVESLAPDLRLPMALHYFAGHSLPDIGALCELPVSTVKKRMRVARAQLREGIDDMTSITADHLSPGPRYDPSDVIRMFTAMRSGDVHRVTAILDARPELVDAREHWSRADSFAHRLPLATLGGGTPLLRAVERGDARMVRALLVRGANPNGACACDAGETPLWVAVAQHEVGIVDELIARGADPNTVALAGLSALDVALTRGYADLVARLLQAGATPSSATRFPDVAVPSLATGIKTIDLWCPMPERGLVHLNPGFGLGAMVVVAELSLRAVMSGRQVVWTGFVPAPTDLGDLHHVLAQSGLIDTVTVALAPPTASRVAELGAFDHGIRIADANGLVVVFAESGRLVAADERLAALAARDGVTLVVGPLDGSLEPPRPNGSPYLASIVFDADRMKKQRFPTVSSASWSKAGDPEMSALAQRARVGMTDELDEYLSQAFYVAHHVTGQPGESVPVSELRQQVAGLLMGGSARGADSRAVGKLPHDVAEQ